MQPEWYLVYNIWQFLLLSFCTLLDLVDLCLIGARILDEALREPESDLFLGVLDGIRAMADITANGKGVVATDGARARLKGVGRAQHDTASFHGIQTLPDHSKDRAREHVSDHAREEGLVAEVLIVLLEMLLGWRDELGGDELEAALLEACGDLANKTTVNTIGLDHDVSALTDVGGHVCFV